MRRWVFGVWGVGLMGWRCGGVRDAGLMQGRASPREPVRQRPWGCQHSESGKVPDHGEQSREGRPETLRRKPGDRPRRFCSTRVLEKPMVSRPLFRVAIGAATVLFLASCAGAPAAEKRAVDANDTAFPVEVTSCGHTSTIEARPTRAITLNQGATEVVLALGLEDQLAGTAYLDDAVPEKWREAYESVPVLSAEYPTADDLVKADPDLLYASYGSAFETKVAGTQAQLDKDGTPSYLSPFGCNDKAERPPTSFDAVWDEIDSVATAFGAPDRAEELRGEQQHRLDELARNRTGEGIDVLWFDSGDKVTFVGGTSGGPQR